MANQNPSDIEKYLRELLECPVCMETIKSVPVYQCANGHVICKDCIEKLNNCPICRNDSELRRSLKLEDIVQRLEGIQPENQGPSTAKPNLQKWGKGSVRSYGTINRPNPHIETPNPQLVSITEAIRQSTINRPNQVTYSEISLQTNQRQTPIEPNLQSNPRQVRTRQILGNDPGNNQNIEAAGETEAKFLLFFFFVFCFGFFGYAVYVSNTNQSTHHSGAH